MSLSERGLRSELTKDELRIALLRAFLDDPTLELGDVHIPRENPNDPNYCSIVLTRKRKQGKDEIVEQFSPTSKDFGLLFEQDFNGLGLLPEGAPIQKRYANYKRATSHIIAAINEIA